MKVTLSAFSLLLAAGSCVADVYMHSPRGSNNRLNERTANRRNGNRCFNSQNNNKGGYNVGDIGDEAAEGDDARDIMLEQYQDVFELGSYMEIEWTNQHGCGVDPVTGYAKNDCQIIVQVMCDNEYNYQNKHYTFMANGENTGRPSENRGFDGDDEPTTCQHEPASLYAHCKKKYRNKGLFIADQNLRGDTAIYTRQNPNANRRGLECEEERDYYPYWGVSPWMDLAVVTNNMESCEAYNNLSQNHLANRAKWCIKNEHSGKDYHELYTTDHFCPHITEDACTEDEECAWEAPVNLYARGSGQNLNELDIPPPLCYQAPYSRVNQLGNTLDGEASRIRIKLWNSQRMHALVGKTCVTRLRYNISTYDYEGMDVNLNPVVDHTFNNKVMKERGEEPLIEQNPTVGIDSLASVSTEGFKLAINTAQFGRTFQDRSHVMSFSEASNTQKTGSVLNLYVRGKRGNIVQTFPSVEYDFVPKILTMAENDRVNFQFAGSNTHNNQNPAGDGQAGDAGEGTGGTDRHNIVPTQRAADNFPMPLEQSVEDGEMFGEMHLDCVWRLVTGGLQNTETPDVLLNNASASWGTHLETGRDCSLKLKEGKYYYMNTRNNNFSNRSQKGEIAVYKAGHPASQYKLTKNSHRDEHFCGSPVYMSSGGCNLLGFGPDGWPTHWNDPDLPF